MRRLGIEEGRYSIDQTGMSRHSKVINMNEKLSIHLKVKPKRKLDPDEWDLAIMPSQFRYPSTIDYAGKTPEQKLAWALLERNLLDICGINWTVGHNYNQYQRENGAKTRIRLKAITEIYLWMNNDARRAKIQSGPDGFIYSFDHWCELLDVDCDYMRRGLRKLLKEQTKDAKGALA